MLLVVALMKNVAASVFYFDDFDLCAFSAADVAWRQVELSQQKSAVAV